MSKITDPKELNKLIDGLSGICADGKKSIRTLVEAITGVELVEKKPAQFKVGDVVDIYGPEVPAVITKTHDDRYILVFLNGHFGINVGNDGRHPVSIEVLSEKLRREGVKLIGKFNYKGAVTPL